jgi:MerR family transcriptional regulator, light-induced transcriptional regulator
LKTRQADGETEALRSIGTVLSELQGEFPSLTQSRLRFWERQGLVTPIRTPGGHRLYGGMEIARIRQIKRWQDDRLSIEEIQVRLTKGGELPAPQRLADQFLTAALAGDHAAAAAVVKGAHELSMPPSRIFGQIFEPALTELGRGWKQGVVSVEQEKEVSQLVRDLVAELSPHASRPDSRDSSIVAACVRGELHELGLLMVVARLRAQGWTVHYLGADVDPEFLVGAVRTRQPSVVLLSVNSEERLPSLETAIRAVQQVYPGAEPPLLVVGGNGVAGDRVLVEAWGAIAATGDELLEIMATLKGKANGEPR